jgi:hypothetical protein
MLVIASALGQGSPVLRSKAAEPDRLIAKASRPGGIRVILTLRGATPLSPPQNSPSASTQQPSAPVSPDPQPGTVEQAAIVAKYVGNDPEKRRRWAPRLIPGTPYMAVTVNLHELEALAADDNVIGIHEDAELRPGSGATTPRGQQ